MPTIPITTLSDSKVPSSASRKTELGEAPLGSQAIGSEMPLAVYMTVTLALAWILVVALFAFGRTTEAAWLLSVVVMFSIVVVGIPFLLRRRLAHVYVRSLAILMTSCILISKSPRANWPAQRPTCRSSPFHYALHWPPRFSDRSGCG
jgi:hypothetical protein